MRNLSVLTTRSFVTANVNLGEYVIGNPDDLINDVLADLAKAFETKLAAVRFAWYEIHIEHLTSHECGAYVTPSELRVLEDLSLFFSVANTIYMNGTFSKDSNNCSFTYFNLNTGLKVAWIAMAL